MNASLSDTASAPGNDEPSTPTQEHLPEANKKFKSNAYTGPQSVIAAAASGLSVTQPQVTTPVAIVSSPPNSAPMPAVSGQYTDIDQRQQPVAGQLMTAAQTVKPTGSGTGAASTAASGTAAISKSPSGGSTPVVLPSLAGSGASGGPAGGGPTAAGGSSGASAAPVPWAALPGEVVTYITVRTVGPRTGPPRLVETVMNESDTLQFKEIRDKIIATGRAPDLEPN